MRNVAENYLNRSKIKTCRNIKVSTLVLGDVSACYVVRFFSWLSVGRPTGSQL